MTARSDFRSNVKAHRFVMNAPSFVAPEPQGSTWARRATWTLLGFGTLLGFACAAAVLVGAVLTLAGVK